MSSEILEVGIRKVAEDRISDQILDMLMSAEEKGRLEHMKHELEEKYLTLERKMEIREAINKNIIHMCRMEIDEEDLKGSRRCMEANFKKAKEEAVRKAV